MPVINQPEPSAAGPSGDGGPCGWVADTSCVSEWDDYSPDVQERALTLAGFVLNAFTGRQFQQCEAILRPCGDRCSFPSYVTWQAAGMPWMIPYVDGGGVWRNCGCGGGCSCLPACSVDLRVPVAEVVEVIVDGLVLDPSAYIMVGTRLARTDGGPCWPSCQDPALDPAAFQVTVRVGQVLPAAGQIAYGALAGEFAAACGGGECRLPNNIAGLTRQGVDVEFVSPQEVLAAGRTGVREADLFIEAVNPTNMRQASVVMSPDYMPHPVRY